MIKSGLDDIQIKPEGCPYQGDLVYSVKNTVLMILLNNPPIYLARARSAGGGGGGGGWLLSPKSYLLLDHWVMYGLFFVPIVVFQFKIVIVDIKRIVKIKHEDNDKKHRKHYFGPNHLFAELDHNVRKEGRRRRHGTANNGDRRGSADEAEWEKTKYHGAEAKEL